MYLDWIDICHSLKLLQPISESRFIVSLCMLRVFAIQDDSSIGSAGDSSMDTSTVNGGAGVGAGGRGRGRGGGSVGTSHTGTSSTKRRRKIRAKKAAVSNANEGTFVHFLYYIG